MGYDTKSIVLVWKSTGGIEFSEGCLYDAPERTANWASVAYVMTDSYLFAGIGCSGQPYHQHLDEQIPVPDPGRVPSSSLEGIGKASIECRTERGEYRRDHDIGWLGILNYYNSNPLPDNQVPFLSVQYLQTAGS